jgi:hypothetical protein
MTSLTLLGDTSGSVVLDAPAVSGSTTLTLPVTSGTLALTTVGLTQTDTWQLNVPFSTSGSNQETFLTSNLTRSAITGQSSYIGAGMTQSSGVFTFPATGVYLINFNLSYYANNQASRYVTNNIYMTTNNSTYNSQSTLGNIWSGGFVYACIFNSTLFNVTDTSLCKVKFSLVPENPLGQVNNGATYMQFIRIGNSV